MSTSSLPSTNDNDFGFSQIQGNPCFRNASVNVVAIVPLLSSSRENDKASAGTPDNIHLSSSTDTDDASTTASTKPQSLKSFNDLMKALRTHHYSSSAGNKSVDNFADHSSTKSLTQNNIGSDHNDSDILLVVPNSSLTRPGDWRYSDTPLGSFHWQHGCQRLMVIDGRPHSSRKSHDQLLNHTVCRHWIDLYPARRVSSVIGVINMNDCKSIEDFYKAEEELHNWAIQYSTPPYAVTSLGQNYERDVPIERLFVYDSFTDDNSKKIDLLKDTTNRIVAFPPKHEDYSINLHLTTLHLNVVINDLAVAVFRELENKLKDYLHDLTMMKEALVNAMDTSSYSSNVSSAMKQQQQAQSVARRTIQRYMLGTTSDDTLSTPSNPQRQATAQNLNISKMANLVNPDSKLAKESPSRITSSDDNIEGEGEGFATVTPPAVAQTPKNAVIKQTPAPLNNIAPGTYQAKLSTLLTPLDDEQMNEAPSLSTKDMDTLRKRDLGRREKWCGDVSLLAGSPLDAYEHYLKAAELLSSTGFRSGTNAVLNSSIDPLWHASALEGCAAAHIAMADCGGYNVDQYLDTNFQLPEEVMVMLSQASNDDNTQNSSKRNALNKQTLPEVVFTLCEESLNILGRNQMLSHLYAELLIKLAKYCADAAEGHLRCQWGIGFGCFNGITNEDGHGGLLGGTGSANDENTPRCFKSSASKLLLSVAGAPNATNKLPSGMNDMATVNTVYRTKKVCELLHTAVSISTLDAATRVDVASQSSVLCLTGVKPTNWKGQLVDRAALPRKSAFFSVVAAETLSMAGRMKQARQLWLLSTQLYSRSGNPSDGRGGSYGWVSLRAFCLEALSLHGSSQIALEGCLQLLSLLGELTPRVTNNKGIPDEDVLASIKTPKKKNTRDELSMSRARRTTQDLTNADRPLRNDFGLSIDESEIRASVFAKNLRESYKFSLANATTLLANQTLKWSEGDIVPSLSVPFGDLASLPTSLGSLKLVWPVADYETCVYAQKRCLDQIRILRRSIPTSSGRELELGFIYGTESKTLPLYVSSAISIHADTALEMECVKKISSPDKSKEGAMATFYNPYEAKKTEKVTTCRVAEEEERAMTIEFGNRLSLPLEVRRSQLEFVNDAEGRVKAASLSFIIPPRATSFTVQFPFTVLSRPNSSTDGHEDNSEIFEVNGLDLTCFGRSFFLPIEELSDPKSKAATGNLPDLASVYPYRSIKKLVQLTPEMKPRVETFPCQPRLHVLFAETGAPVERLVIGLSDGEIHTIPAFRLENYKGPSAMGKIERLQIYSANVPGTGDKKLYDSDSPPIDIVNESDFVKELTWKDNSPPLLVRALTTSLKLNSVNESRGRNAAEDDTVTFQIAASHNLGERIPKGITMHIRFRYRGLSNSSTEVWRKREVVLHIKHAKGPRISSIAFRPDFAREGAIAEMSLDAAVPRPMKGVPNKSLEEDYEVKDDRMFILNRVGLDKEINVCNDKAYFILTVANETRSVLSLERIGGLVGGFEHVPLETITVRPGVSAKFPMVIDRFPRIDTNGQPIDIVSELVSRTSLIWKSHRGGEAGPVKARGNIRIPPACLKDILVRQPSLVTHICKPPCSIELFVGRPVTSETDLQVVLGRPVDLSVDVLLESWVPKSISAKCSLTIEFRCGKKRHPGATDCNGTRNKEYFWAGKLRHSVAMSSPTENHKAKIAFCVPGRYVVSACIKISQIGCLHEEVWWAPIAQNITANQPKLESSN